MDLSTPRNEDKTDARGLFWKSKSDAPMGSLPVALDSDFYNMNHLERGKCLIFNNKQYDLHTKLSVRNGTDNDAEYLRETFKYLEFSVMQYNDYGVRNILSTLEQVAAEDHSKRDCLVCCILTHGEEGSLFGKDGRFQTDQVFKPFQADSCISLAGKPKIFFIQACQGDRLDAGVSLKVESTDSSAVCKIPNRADFLIAYSTVPGFYSWRNTANGSWFIQSLCQVLKQYGDTLDLLDMMTLVNRKVAYSFQSCVPGDPGMDKMKQVPCVTSTLTRKIFFQPKI